MAPSGGWNGVVISGVFKTKMLFKKIKAVKISLVLKGL